MHRCSFATKVLLNFSFPPPSPGCPVAKDVSKNSLRDKTFSNELFEDTFDAAESQKKVSIFSLSPLSLYGGEMP